MTENEIEPAPTGAFREGAPDRPAAERPPASYSRDTAQDVSRSRGSDDESEGTAERAPIIDRPSSGS
jgi:hypothetical protein